VLSSVRLVPSCWYVLLLCMDMHAHLAYQHIQLRFSTAMRLLASLFCATFQRVNTPQLHPTWL
jgi:tryptophan-rich sensory protein